MGCCKDFRRTTLDDGTVVEAHSFGCPAMAKERSEAEEKRLREKGHDCNDHLVHQTYDRGNGVLGDSYVCGICGDLIQVG